MALVAIDGFDLYNGTGANTGMQARWLAYAGPNYTLVAGRFGGQAFAASSTNSQGSLRLNFPAAYASLTVGHALRLTVMPTLGVGTVHPFMMLMTGGVGFQVGARVNADGAIEVYRLTSASAGTLLGTSANGVIALNTWHYIECEVTISDTVGVFSVWVDGVQRLNLTGQDTRNGAPTTVDAIVIGNISAAAGQGTHQFDDLYVNDTASKIGERRVETLYPTSDVTQVFARSAGAVNFSLVDEAQVNGDTDYVQGSVVGA